MLLLVVVIFTVVVTISSEATEYVRDQEASPSPTSPTTASSPFDLNCNALSEGVRYTVERCNKTKKTILKVSVKDEYKLTVPKAPITEPPRPATTTESPERKMQNLLDNIFSTKVPSAEIEDDWDYLEEVTGDSEEVRSIVRTEILRHEILRLPLPNRQSYHFRPDGDFSEFCAAAAKEDEEPVLVQDGSFHPKYEEVPGVGVYRLHATPRAWADARGVCEREGAQLAVPNSREEAEALADIHNRCPRLLLSHFNDYQYLGAHDEYGEGNWETIVGYPLNETGYMNWAFGQPDNAHHKGENCLTMNRHAFFNDVPCWTELPYICEHV